MSLVGASLEVKGTFGRWSTRFFTLIGTEDGTLLLRTYMNEEAHNSNRDPQSTRAIAGFSDLEDRDSARPNRFDLTLVRGNGTEGAVQTLAGEPLRCLGTENLSQGSFTADRDVSCRQSQVGPGRKLV